MGCGGEKVVDVGREGGRRQRPALRLLAGAVSIRMVILRRGIKWGIWDIVG